MRFTEFLLNEMDKPKKKEMPKDGLKSSAGGKKDPKTHAGYKKKSSLAKYI